MRRGRRRKNRIKSWCYAEVQTPSTKHGVFCADNTPVVGSFIQFGGTHAKVLLVRPTLIGDVGDSILSKSGRVISLSGAPQEAKIEIPRRCSARPK